jgi:hypothetical protein
MQWKWKFTFILGEYTPRPKKNPLSIHMYFYFKTDEF